MITGLRRLASWVPRGIALGVLFANRAVNTAGHGLLVFAVWVRGEAF